MSDDQITKADLEARAKELGITGASSLNKDDLAQAIADAEEAAAKRVSQPAPSPDKPTDGRPPLAQIAEESATAGYVRVIGGGKE